MQGTISIGDSINTFIVDMKDLVNDLSQAIEYTDLILNMYSNGDMYEGTAYEQIKKFADNLYLQIYKMNSFYELGVKYMEDARDKLKEADKESKDTVSSIGISN